MLNLRQTGMTLLELLVAIAILAMLAAMAYGGLDSIMKAGYRSGSEANRLAKLQLTLHMLEKDLLQTVPRSIRTYMSPLPAIGSSDSTMLEFTRTGLANPLGINRSHLVRIRYRLEKDTLYRDRWGVLDRPDDSSLKSSALLEGVTEFGVRYYQQKQWFDTWPVDSLAGLSLTQLPEAVEVNLTLSDWGRFKRLVVLR